MNAYHDAQRRLAGALGAFLAGIVWFFLYVVPVFLPLFLLYLGLGKLIAWGVVNRWHWLTRPAFNYLWAAVGLASLAIAYPMTLLFFLALAGSLGLLQLGMWTYARFWGGNR